MYLNDQGPQPQFSSDYLNQIATTPTVKTVSPFIVWGLIGGLLLLGLIVILAVGSAKKAPTASSLTNVAATFSQLQTVTDNAQDNIQSSELRTLNSSLLLTLTNTNRDLSEPLKAKKISLKDKKNETVINVTKDFTALSDRLEDARLNAVYDRTYAREMTYELKTLRSNMAVLYKNSRSTTLKETLLTADQNLKPLLEGFETVNGS